ncbi:MAG: hypothetical protein KatS3mg108_3416 [Isosphaeraceae bacterium]|jgi:pSer/pThr/pTyr-binding forkhead associated (FHA) protein|nr:MAG: hypothetical protein KatS3mg108_3416 [Isosphaeraceae bacterium]
MNTHPKELGVMRPVGGGDPIPLRRETLIVGRRPTADIRLDFENVSGRHCELRFVNGVWHVRDLNSTNGTMVNGQKIFSEHGLMPDDELSIAGHIYMIDYDPVAPTSLIDANLMLEEEMAGNRRRSLMEMAGIGTDRESSSYRRIKKDSGDQRPVAPPDPQAADPQVNKPAPAAETSANQLSDDDFLALIRQDLEGEQ